MAVLGSVSCGFDIERIHPHFLDPDKGYSRVYEVKKVTPAQCGDPDYDFVYTGTKKPISEMAGYVCIPVEEYQYMISRYEEANKKKCAAQAGDVTK